MRSICYAVEIVHQAGPADLPDDAELLRLDFAGADSAAQMVRIIAAEGGGFGGGYQILMHYDLPLALKRLGKYTEWNRNLQLISHRYLPAIPNNLYLMRL